LCLEHFEVFYFGSSWNDDIEGSGVVGIGTVAAYDGESTMHFTVEKSEQTGGRGVVLLVKEQRGWRCLFLAVSYIRPTQMVLLKLPRPPVTLKLQSWIAVR
jgi:hypothetical protein